MTSCKTKWLSSMLEYQKKPFDLVTICRFLTFLGKFEKASELGGRAKLNCSFSIFENQLRWSFKKHKRVHSSSVILKRFWHGNLSRGVALSLAAWLYFLVRNILFSITAVLNNLLVKHLGRQPQRIKAAKATYFEVIRISNLLGLWICGLHMRRSSFLHFETRMRGEGEFYRAD